MIRIVALIVILTAACGPNKNFGSICNDPAAPEACSMACDATPGAANTCPGGFHCSEGSTCDAQCTTSGGQCGDGYTCTADGRCVDDSGPGSNGPDANCPAVSFTPMPTTPSIGLVLDQSGSMFPPESNGYEEMKEALVGTTGVVTQLESKAYFGSMLYTCTRGGLFDPPKLLTTETPRMVNNAAAVRASIESKDTGRNTPTHLALDKMVASFAANPPPAGSPPAIVLATDGLPNTCPDAFADRQPQTVQAAAAAYAAGIPVYVLAMNVNSQHFQDLANAGQGWKAGQPNVRYYPSQNAQELKAAFDAIITGIVSCDLALTSEIDATLAMSGTVTVNGTVLTYGTDWVLVNGRTIRLVGAACANLKTTPNPTVNATFPCGAVIL